MSTATASSSAVVTLQHTGGRWLVAPFPSSRNAYDARFVAHARMHTIGFCPRDNDSDNTLVPMEVSADDDEASEDDDAEEEEIKATAAPITRCHLQVSRDGQTLRVPQNCSEKSVRRFLSHMLTEKERMKLRRITYLVGRFACSCDVHSSMTAQEQLSPRKLMTLLPSQVTKLMFMPVDPMTIHQEHAVVSPGLPCGDENNSGVTSIDFEATTCVLGLHPAGQGTERIHLSMFHEDPGGDMISKKDHYTAIMKVLRAYSCRKGAHTLASFCFDVPTIRCNLHYRAMLSLLALCVSVKEVLEVTEPFTKATYADNTLNWIHALLNAKNATEESCNAAQCLETLRQSLKSASIVLLRHVPATIGLLCLMAECQHQEHVIEMSPRLSTVLLRMTTLHQDYIKLGLQFFLQCWIGNQPAVLPDKNTPRRGLRLFLQMPVASKVFDLTVSAVNKIKPLREGDLYVILVGICTDETEVFAQMFWESPTRPKGQWFSAIDHTGCTPLHALGTTALVHRTEHDAP